MASKLYVGGLSYSTTSETLREYFAQCGTVESASVITDKFSGQSRGFGFVEMATAEEAQRAISELNGKDLDGRKITVNVSNPRTPGSGGGRRGGGGGTEAPTGCRPRRSRSAGSAADSRTESEKGRGDRHRALSLFPRRPSGYRMRS
jgi:RNA recognition motif-containing protein